MSNQSNEYFTRRADGPVFKVTVSRRDQIDIVSIHKLEDDTEILRPTEVLEVFVGDDPEHKNSRGSTVLVRLSETQFMYIGCRIQTFYLATDERVESYHSPCDKAGGWPTPFLVTNQRVILMLCGVGIPRSMVNEAMLADPYSWFGATDVRLPAGDVMPKPWLDKAGFDDWSRRFEALRAEVRTTRKEQCTSMHFTDFLASQN